VVRTQEPGSPKARGRPLASRTDFFKIGARPSVGSARAMAAEAEPEPESEERQLGVEWRGWVPYRVRFKNGAATTTWVYLGAERLVDPFMHHTVARLERREGWPERRTTLTPEALAAAAAVTASTETLPGLEPAVFVLHCSRCGSTLLCNALRAVGTTSVVAEPGAVNDLLLHLTATDMSSGTRTEAESLLQPLCTALTHQRCGDEQRVVIKSSSWNVLALRSQLRRAWPNTPWIFVFRDPVEVSVSQLRDPSGWMSLRTSNPSAAAQMFGVQESDLADMSPEQWCALVLAKFYEAAVVAAEEDPRRCLLLGAWPSLARNVSATHRLYTPIFALIRWCVYGMYLWVQTIVTSTPTRYLSLQHG
jgi:hypothetical protein